MANFEARQHFKASEFKHPDKMEDSFISKLELARATAGVPFVVTSDWREKGDGKSHHLGKAVDIRCRDAATREAILRGAVLAGIRRIGTYYATIDGDGRHEGGHIHLDDNQPEEGFPYGSWIGKSRR